jgi:tyrosyl-tRNA synthetase
MTELVHGAVGVLAAQRISEALFSGEVGSLSEAELLQLKLDGLPSIQLERATLEALPLTQLLTDSGLATSGKQVKDALAARAVLLNGQVLEPGSNMNLSESFAREKALHDRFYVLRLGKKKYQLIEVAQ